MSELETEDLSKIFENFKGEVFTEMNNALKRAIRKTAVQIQQKTIENAKAGIKTYNNRQPGPDVYENDNILEAVRVGKIQDRYDEDEMFMKVHVMGNGRPNSKTFRFRFLEKGTKERYVRYNKNGDELKTPKYIGRIDGRRWFKSARQSIGDPLPIFEEEINKAIRKINK